MREQLVLLCEIIPLEVVVRNIVAGSLASKLGIKEGTNLSRPIVEFYYKDDSLNDPMVSEEHISAFEWASNQEVEEMIAQTLRVNDFLSGMLLGIGIRLVDFKIEFGRIFDESLPRIVVADEISPDCCRLWDVDSKERFDKDIFRHDLGDLTKAYSELAKRLGVMPKQSSRIFPPKLVS